MDERMRLIGQRVKEWRRRRGLTRQQFADLVGRSLSWVDKIEAGERGLQRLPVLERVAEALGVDSQVLSADGPRRSESCPEASEVVAIKSALGRYDTALNSDRRGRAEPDVRRLRQRVQHANLAWFAAHYRSLGQSLPDLILDAQNAVEALSGDAREDATRQQVIVYRLASSVLLKFECTDIAWMAADRGIALARTLGDIRSLARASRSVARAMTSAGQRGEAIGLLVSMSDRVEREVARPTAEILSLQGMLLLSAEIAAAKDGDANAASELHLQAEATANRLDANHVDAATAFGSWNVKLHRVASLVRLQEGPAAVASAGRVGVPDLALLPAERRVNFWLDVASAQEQCGKFSEATSALLDAERISPQEVRCRPVAHALIRRLADRSTGSTAKTLSGLAERAGIAA